MSWEDQNISVSIELTFMSVFIVQYSHTVDEHLKENYKIR
jgi:uncharacterized protein Veg